MSYYQHRISHWWEVSRPLLDKGYLTIGFRNLSKSGIIDERDDDDKFDEIYKKYFSDTRRKQVHRFLNLKNGDTVVVPLYNKQFAVVEVIGNTDIIDNLPQNIKSDVGLNDEVDLGFFSPVKIINVTQRSYASSKLQSRMKNFMTNISVDDLSADIEDAKNVKGPVNFQKK